MSPSTQKAGFPRQLRRSVVSFWNDPTLRTALVLCIPALAIGLTLRVLLMAQMPRALYHPDSHTVFETYHYFVSGWNIHVSNKKTFLVPVLYAIPAILHLPLLQTIAAGQHALGLLLIILAGLLVAYSFRLWKLFIIPVTVLVAVNPTLLWYEHVALPESIYVFWVAATALTGLFFYQQPASKLRFVGFLVSLFFTAASRPEGKFFCLFGVALAIAAFWNDKPLLFRKCRAVFVVTLLCFLLNRTHESGSLLYSNVVHLTPPKLWTAPGFAEFMSAHLAELRKTWDFVPTRIPHERSNIIKFVQQYQAQQPNRTTQVTDSEIDSFCSKVAFETCSRNLFALPTLALKKWLYALREPTARSFGSGSVYNMQLQGFGAQGGGGDDNMSDEKDDSGSETLLRRTSSVADAELAFRREFKTSQQLNQYVRQVYQPFQPDWLSRFQAQFNKAVLAWRLSDQKQNGHTIWGAPLLYVAAACGLFALGLQEHRSRSYYFLWLAMLAFMVFLFGLTGSNKGRFRIAFEPFWFIYAFALVNVIASWMLRLRPRRQAHLSEHVERVGSIKM
jgi:hypothetical protein